MSTLILMSDNRDLNENFKDTNYNTLTTFINYKYCEKHNYDFSYFIPNLEEKNDTYNCLSKKNELRHSSWSKILSVLKIIDETTKYEKIVYLDSDCIFDNDKINVDEYLNSVKNINNDNLNFLSKIIFMNNQPWSFNLPCAGFFIAYNNDKIKKILKDWYNDDNSNYNTKHPWEQNTLQNRIIKNYPNDIEVINDWMFRKKDGQFLRHIGSEEHQNRIPFFKNYILKNFDELMFTKTISKLKENIVKYNTNSVIKKLY